MPRETKVSENTRVHVDDRLKPLFWSSTEASIPSESKTQMPTVGETDSSIRQLPALPVSD